MTPKKDDTGAKLENLRGRIEVIDQKLVDYIKRNDSKIEDAHTVANVLLGKHDDMKKDNARLREELLEKFAELESRVSAATQVARDTTSNTVAAAAQIEKAEALIQKIVDEQREFMNSFFVKLLIAFGVQVIVLLIGVLVSIHFAGGK